MGPIEPVSARLKRSEDAKQMGCSPQQVEIKLKRMDGGHLRLENVVGMKHGTGPIFHVKKSMYNVGQGHEDGVPAECLLEVCISAHQAHTVNVRRLGEGERRLKLNLGNLFYLGFYNRRYVFQKF